MTFDISKCKAMLVSRKICQQTPPSLLILNGANLEFVSTYKYPGALISSNLTWSAHIQKTGSKAMKLLGLLYRQFY